MSIRILALILSLLLSATTAQATPPQIVGVSETLFGVNDTHLFVLRRTGDNMGMHWSTQTDVFLIARNRKTNDDDEIWPVMRMIDHGADYIESGFQQRVETLPLNARANPFDILLSRNARPLLGPGLYSKLRAGTKVTWAQDVMTLVTDKHSYQLQDALVTKRFTSSLNGMRKTLAPYFIEGGDRGKDILLDVEFDPAQDCQSNGFSSFFEYIDKEFTQFWITKITCGNDDTMASISMHFLVPKVP